MEVELGNLTCSGKCRVDPAHHKSSLRPQIWYLSNILHRRIFRPKILHPYFHQISTVLVIKTPKKEWKWRNLHRWQKFYTAAGTDGTDKFHLWLIFNLLLPFIEVLVHTYMDALRYHSIEFAANYLLITKRLQMKKFSCQKKVGIIIVIIIIMKQEWRGPRDQPPWSSSWSGCSRRSREQCGGVF